MAFLLGDNLKVTVKITGLLDAKGQPVDPATLPKPPVWGVSDATLMGVTPAADGLSADFAGIALGAVQGNVTVTNADGTTAVGTLDFQVVAGDVASIQLTPGTPVAQ
jgi:hypothetical protein